MDLLQMSCSGGSGCFPDRFFYFGLGGDLGHRNGRLCTVFYHSLLEVFPGVSDVPPRAKQLCRDFELSCDEEVVRIFGEKDRAAYARTLIGMEEKKSSLRLFGNNFSKNAIEERIMAIMKIRKVTAGAILIAAVLLVAITALFATSAKEKDGRKPGAYEPQATLAQTVAQYRGITYAQFRQETGEEAELYHADRFIAAIPGTEVDVIFAGEYDEDLAGYVLGQETRYLRLEGKLGALLTGIVKSMTPEELSGALAGNAEQVPEYHLEEGAGTAYYVADRYVAVEFDSNGDGTEDARLEIEPDSTGKVGPESYAWLY